MSENHRNRPLTAQRISGMSYDDLVDRYTNLKSYVERERHRGREHRPEELDVCYLYRELETRHWRARCADFRDEHVLDEEKTHSN